MDTRQLNTDDMSDEELTEAEREASDYAAMYEMGQGASYREEASLRLHWKSRSSKLRRALKARGLPTPS